MTWPPPGAVVIGGNHYLRGCVIEVMQCHACKQEVNFDEVEPERCLYFEADCHGDSIALCKKHLKMVMDQMEVKA